MSLLKTLSRNRWFILAVLILLLNAYAVFTGTLHRHSAVSTMLINPANGEISGRQSVTWRFSSQMVSQIETGRWESAGPVVFHPAVNGRFNWERTDELTFTPDRDWPNCSLIRTMLDRGLRALDSRPVETSKTMTLRTEALRLKKAEQIAYLPGKEIRIMLSFNAPVTRGELSEKLSVIGTGGGNMVFEVPAYDGGKKDIAIAIPAGTAGLPTNGVAVCLKTGLLSTVGPLGLPRDINVPVALMADIQLMAVTPDDAGPFGPFSIVASFSAQVEPQSVTEHLTVEPEVKVTVEPVPTYYGQDCNQVRIAGDFKAGRRYVLKIRDGLAAQCGARLKTAVTRVVYFEDAAQGVRITADGKYLSTMGSLSLPFETINIDKLHVTAWRVFANNIVHLVVGGHDYNGFDDTDSFGARVFDDDVRFSSATNRTIRNNLSLRDITSGKPGVYFLSLTGNRGEHTCEERQHIVISDIGLSVKRGEREVLVWANSIRTLDTLDGATIKLYSEKNQELASGTTGTNGLVLLSFATNSAAGSPCLIVAERGDDMTYLRLASSVVSPRESFGNRDYVTAGYEAFVFTERGVYRPGEKAHVGAIVRGSSAGCPDPFPVTLAVYRPDGKPLQKFPAMLNLNGVAEFEIPFPDYVPTGSYRFDLELAGVAKPVGTTRASVEEFAPPQIKVDVTAEQAPCIAGTNINFEITANRLFGGPAANLPVEAAVEFDAQPFTASKWPDYQFGDAGKEFKHIRQVIGRATLDSDGKAAFVAPTGKQWLPPAAIRAVLAGTVTETSGRAVTAVRIRRVDAYPFYVGIRSNLKIIRIGKECAFEIITVLPDGTARTEPVALKAVVEKTVWSSLMKKTDDGKWSYVSEKQTSKIASGDVTTSSGRCSYAFTPADWGEYRITVADPESGTSSSFDFYAGEPGTEWSGRSLEEQETVEIKLDKERYTAGDSARLLITAPFAGKALLTIESTRVLKHWILDMTNNAAEVDFKVEETFAPNVFCTVSIIKPVKTERLWGAHRAFGIAPLVVDAPEHKLQVTLTAPETMRPNQQIEVTVEVSGVEGPAAECDVMIAAVDEGICMLTDFKTPDPYAFFFAPRRCGVSQHDLYALLMPELEESLGADSSETGGSGLPTLSRRLNPIRTRRFTPVALWSSRVKTDSAGKAHVTFNIPEFTGQLRLMAVAIDNRRFGSTERAVKVKSPLMVESGLPRFLAPGDLCDMPIHILNQTGTSGEAVVTITCGGSLAFADGTTSMARRVSAPASADTLIEVQMRATRTPGVGTCRIEAVLGSERCSSETSLPVRSPSSFVVACGSGRIEPGATARVEMPADWMEGTGSNDVSISALPAVELGGGLNYLLRYPYGCLEQTTSKSFPLLYLADIAKQLYPGWLDREQVLRFVDDGIQRILAMQRRNGSFGAWFGCDSYQWGSIYATHLLVEASKAGYGVPPDRLQAALSFLVRIVSGSNPDGNDQSDSLYDRSYAAYVLALAGKPQHGAIGRMRELPRADMDNATRVNVAAALLAAGLRKDAHEVLSGISGMNPSSGTRSMGGSLRSDTRDTAMLLSVMVESDPANTLIPALVKRLNAARINGRWYTTQENAMALLAIGKYCRLLENNSAPVSGIIAWNRGAATASFTNRESFHVPTEDMKDSIVVISNSGAGPMYYYWKAEGIPVNGPVKEEFKGIRVQRQILDSSGQPVDPGSLLQGRLYIVRLLFEDRAGGLDNIVVEDLLPAGLEIENPNLKTSQVIGWLRDKATLSPLHTDIRDDRLILFTGSFSGTSEYYYAVRTVSAGTFTLPAVTAECMYDPDVKSVQGMGTLTVKREQSK